jgi:hypothetical protein
MKSHFVREKCVRARAGLCLFASKCQVFTFSRLDLSVRGWKTRKNTSGSSVGVFFCILCCVFTCFRLFRPRWKAVLYVKNVCARVLGFACFRQNVEFLRIFTPRSKCSWLENT